MIFNAIKIKEIIKNKIKEEGRKSINFLKNKMEHYFLSGVIKKKLIIDAKFLIT